MLSERRVLLTGASSGIGAAVLDTLIAAGNYDVTVLGRNRPEREWHGRFLQVDLASPQETQNAISAVLQSNGSFDALVSNAGAGIFRPIESIRLEEWQHLIALNVTAPFLLIRALLPGMRTQGFGRLVAISSDADHLGFAGASAYCASKYALAGLAEAVRKELVGVDITITTISPGRVDTQFNGKRPGDRPLSLTACDVAHQVMNVLETAGRCHIESIRLKSSLE